MPALRRWRVGLAVLGLALVGCADTEGGSEAVKHPTTTRADEKAQAERQALRTLRAFCTGTRLALPNEAPEKVGRGDAVEAVSLLIDHARRGIRRGDDEDNVAWREHLGWLSGQLERSECLSDQVARVDRALRRMPLPDVTPPEDYYDPRDEYEYEPYP
jgi:hypothetical protein